MGGPRLVIFDLGGVVFEASFEWVFEAWAGSLAIPTEEVRQRFRFDRGFELFERGAMPPSDYHRHIAEGLGLPLGYGDFVAGWNAVYGEPHSSVVSLLERIRRSYRLVAFTNTNELHQEVWPAKYERELVHFDRIFSSCDMGHRKPEAEAFRHVLDRCGAQPSETLFLDDFPANVDGARACGLSAILVTDPQSIRSQLAGAGLEIDTPSGTRAPGLGS